MARLMVNKRAYCKGAVFLHATPTGLQSSLSGALGKLKTIGTRKESSGEDARYCRSVIYFREAGGMLFGIFAAYEKGTHQLTVADDDKAEMLSVEQVAPPATKDAKRQEFLEGICYFAIKKNHVVVLPSRALGSKALEGHMNWLLDLAGGLASGNRVGLSEQLSKATKEKIRKSHVKSVEIGAPLLEPREITEQVKVGSHVRAFEYTGLGLDILKQVLGIEKVEKMKLADALDGNIEVSLKIRYVRKTTEKAHRLLDNIALAVRNIDEDDVKLTLAGGATVRGNELKLSNVISVETRDGIPNPDELFSKMRAWLQKLLEDSIIEP